MARTFNCRYDGRNSENKVIVELVKQGQAIPVCPEQLIKIYIEVFNLTTTTTNRSQ